MKNMVLALWISLVISVACGSLTGLLEAVYLLTVGPNPYLNRLAIINYIIVYSVIWGIAGLPAGIAISIISKLVKLNIRLSLTLFFVLFSIYYLAGYYTNSYLLPGFYSIPSLIFDAALFISLAVLGVWTYRRIAGNVSAGKTDVHGYFKWRYAVMLWMGCILVGVAAGAWPRMTPSYHDDSLSPPGGISDPSYNVLIISIDTLRKDHMSFFGYERKTTPNIERHFKDGVWFPNAYSQASHTKPSTASLLTSLYVSTHKMSHITAGLPEEVVTATEIFQALEYKTSIFSTNNFVSPFFGFDQGVDYFYVARERDINASGLVNITVRISRDSPSFMRRMSRGLLKLIRRLEVGVDSTSLKTADVNDESATAEFIDWIEKIGDARFFTYIHFIAPHSPYHPPAPFDELYIPYPGVKLRRIPELNGLLPFDEGSPMPEDELANMVGQYDGEINFIDNQVGIIMDRLQSLDLDKNTLVVVTADHGEEFFDHNGYGHGLSLFNEVINVPLILRQPSLIRRTGEIEINVQQVDLLPTILDLLGYPVPTFLQGASFSELLTDTADVYEDHRIITELDFIIQGARSIILGDDKLIYSFHGLEKSTMLFDLESDENEKVVLNDEKPEMLNALSRELEEVRMHSVRNDLQSDKLFLNETIKEELRALGYIE